jgi:centrosomal protein CEP57
MYENDYTDDNEGNQINKSYNSSFSASSMNATSSSKAVLAALRALQDKIRRLEAERSQALDETTQLKHQLKNMEIESEHSRQRDNLLAQKTLQENKSIYDRLLNEKTELEVRIGKLEEKNRLTQLSVDEFSNKIKNLEDEKQKYLLHIKELEYEQQQIEMQIKHSQNKEKGFLYNFFCLHFKNSNVSLYK